MRIPIKLIEMIAKQGSKELDLGNPLTIDTVNFIIEIGKEVLKPW
jgi:hypothetical protein